ncbi:Gfo/Idh/MocA family oxidoreductase [Jeongeupia chitinilytica]|uniref:Gfo/Idh/MocA-like oxidoreductase N-terminal domain-containing protein n=1 Tax=Jeongeupia chitinilytica TaxID=1041641 RepID=A0ABQ3GVJ1_9NEIS|nr:Gfo/Idh/MocA family oxidoreductase [Jeongeupia chitinilytica]GHD56911.1 hypothetical protein GCM10007350_04800 [Jeongeupia chitinilytica]
MNSTRNGALRLGIIGCGPGSHGLMWAGQWQQQPAHGLVAARFWDADPAVAATLAAETGASHALSADAVGDDCDGVVITGLDPRDYLALARPHLLAGRRVFLNRPLAGSPDDARELLALADRHGGAVYSASALMHTGAAARVRQALTEIGPLRFFTLTGPTDTADWYLPHLYACLASTLGTGLERIVHAELPCNDGNPHQLVAPASTLVEYGADSAVGPVRGVLSLLGPDSAWYGFTLKLFGQTQSAPEIEFDVGYTLLFEAMRRFFTDGTRPIPADLMLEQVDAYYATLAAARTGKPVALATMRKST